MTLGAAILAHLLADADIAALVGSRVYAVIAPQEDDAGESSPTIAFALAAREIEYAMGRRMLDRTLWAFICVAADYDVAHSIADELVSSIDQFRGTMGGAGGVLVKNVQVTNERDIPDDDGLGLYIVGVEAEITI